MFVYSLELPGTDDILRDCSLQAGGAVQRAIDSEVLRVSAPYVPFLEGYLARSGIIHTVIGSGEVVYDADNKARRLYYGGMDWNWSNGGVQEGGLRGPYWVQRAMENGGYEKVTAAAQRAAGRK